jgi:hypothetical protein
VVRKKKEKEDRPIANIGMKHTSASLDGDSPLSIQFAPFSAFRSRVQFLTGDIHRQALISEIGDCAPF